jgi:hypothetical protein
MSIMCVGAVCKLDVHNCNVIDNRTRNRRDYEKDRGDEEQERANVMENTSDTHFDSVEGRDRSALGVVEGRMGVGSSKSCCD